MSSYHSRIKNCSDKKKTPIILALDYDFDQYDNSYLYDKCKELISMTESKICAIKINFHLLLSLSHIQILELNLFAHNFDLQSIADIKLNDIGNTNKVTINKLQKLGFDAVIVNPFIGLTEMKSIVSYAHSINFGIISLVYMSHPYSFEGYGLNIVIPSSSSSFSSSTSTGTTITANPNNNNNNNNENRDPNFKR